MTSSSLSAWNLETNTVQAPHDPSPQDNFVPVSPDLLRYCIRVCCNCGASMLCWSPLIQNVKFFIIVLKKCVEKVTLDHKSIY